MPSTGRLFQCVRCFKQIIICSSCDRGQRYCSPDCSNTSRIGAQREAGHRYQQSRKGRIKHALRMRHYRRRKQIVTHQGSQPSAQNGLLQANSVDVEQIQATSHQSVIARKFQCHFCGCHCSELMRLDFIRRRRVSYSNPLERRGNRNDYSP